jgi:hypothetical protein
MPKRKQAPAASSSSLPQRKRSKNVDDRSACGKGFSTAFMIVVDALSKMNKESSNYIYQVPLRPGQELCSSIGTFSHLFGLDENKTFKVLKDAGLIGVEGKQRKPVFKTQQWELITNIISGFVWTKNYGRQKAFTFRLGSKGEKSSIARQIKAKQAPPKSRQHSTFEHFELRWRDR